MANPTHNDYPDELIVDVVKRLRAERDERYDQLMRSERDLHKERALAGELAEAAQAMIEVLLAGSPGWLQGKAGKALVAAMFRYDEQKGAE